MANTTKWVLDPTHSELNFKVKHLMISNVKGSFQNFEATLLSDDDDFRKASVSVNIEAASIFTNQADRDAHLRSADFFDVENHPNITFQGTSCTRFDEENYRLTGQLTIRGISREVSLDVEFGGTGTDPWGNEKAGFSISGQINRKDFDLNWNAALEAGGVLVGEEVKFSAEVQFVKQAQPVKKILVTGATGQFGSATINSLLEKGHPVTSIAALVRDEQKAAELKSKGIEIRIGDYDDVPSLEKAFAGIDTVLFVSASDVEKRVAQHENVVKALSASSVKHVVYTSFVRDENAGPSAIDFVTEAHVKTEQWLKESGITWTFLRNNLYMDFVPVFIGDNVLESGVYFPAGTGKAAVATREDMAEAAANVLLTEGHENKIYNLSNTEAWSFEEVAETLANVTGKSVNYYSPSQQEYRQTLSGAGVPEGYVGMFAAFGEAVKQEEFDTISTDLENLLGRKPLSLEQYFQGVYTN